MRKSSSRLGEETLQLLLLDNKVNYSELVDSRVRSNKDGTNGVLVHLQNTNKEKTSNPGIAVEWDNLEWDGHTSIKNTYQWKETDLNRHICIGYNYSSTSPSSFAYLYVF